MISASMLYNLVQCPHRLALDLCADPRERDPANEFVKLLWERGLRHENSVVDFSGCRGGGADGVGSPSTPRL